MNVKTDTKEKFIVLTPDVDVISANMTGEVKELGDFATAALPHLVINLKNVTTLSVEAARSFAELQDSFYQRDCSLVICEMQPLVADVFEQAELSDLMNTTPTESEAWDILQMEEVERDLMKDFEKDDL